MKTRQINIIAVFGDSLVRGSKCPEGKKWVGRLKIFLRKFYKMDAVYNLGIDGETSEGLLKRFNAECKARKPNIIIINIGTNDSQYNAKNNSFRVPLRKFINNINQLIIRGRKFTSKIVIIGLLPVVDFKGLNFSDNNKYHKKYNEAIRLIAQKNNIPFVNLFKLWTKMDYNKLLATDGIHLNLNGHQEIFKSVKESLIINNLLIYHQ